MKQAFENINQVLAEWDPIGVGKDIAINEYQGYIPLIIESIENKHKLISCLEDILVNEMGLEYDSKNEEHLADLQVVSDRIIQAYQEA